MVSLKEKIRKKQESKIVKFSYVNSNYFKIENTDKKFLEQIYNFFSVEVPGYQFMPHYRAGIWDGKIKYFDKLRQTLPIGLVLEANRYITKLFRDKRVLLENELKEKLFNKKLKDIKEKDFSLKYKLYSHQIESIQKALYYKRATFRIPTGGGKTLIQACIMDYLYHKGECSNFLAIVPTIQLTEQFKKELILYGISEENIGIIRGDIKDKPEKFQKVITISTYQSLMQKESKKSKKLKWKEFLKIFDCIIVDECHLCKAIELKRIVTNCTGSKYRLGFTGTLPDSKADLYGILAFIGPKVLDIGIQDLIQNGVISDLKINTIEISYSEDYKNLSWQETKQKVIKEPKRLKLIEFICKNSKKNILILVSFVETEGQILKKYLEKKLPDRLVHFIHGGVDIITRENIRTSAEVTNKLIIIATYGTFKMGINIKNLHKIIFASPLAAKIATLQSIGRGLRVLPGKKLIVYDIVDMIPFLRRHGKIREKYWKKEKFIVNKIST